MVSAGSAVKPAIVVDARTASGRNVFFMVMEGLTKSLAICLQKAKLSIQI
jgi:hypothetical protein